MAATRRSALPLRLLALLGVTAVAYAAAKALKRFDRPIYEILGFTSGHTLKHLAAALGCWVLVSMLSLRARL